jgi:phospholipid/cholesterol/gamma-HCH transport system substrate-binding protein
MKISTEIKVGIIGIVSLVVLIWGINYLKGRNILSSTYKLYAFYPETGGLESSAPVMLNGFKIGYVDEIMLRTAETPPIRVTLNIEREYPVPDGSIAELYGADLMGTKEVRIIMSERDQVLKNEDTIMAATVPDLLTSLQSRIVPVLDLAGQLVRSLDSLSQQLATVIGSGDIGEILDRLASITGSLDAGLQEGGSLDRSFKNLELFTAALAEQDELVVSLIGHLNSVSEALDTAGLDKLSAELYLASSRINTLLEQVNSGEGNAGRLLYNDTLYMNLEKLIADLDHLVNDLNENPQDYVHFSLFGKSGRKK